MKSMAKITVPRELAAINALSVLLIVLIEFLPSVSWRALIGIPFVVFFPGYCLLMGFLPRKAGMTTLEITVISVGLSCAVFPLVGVGLNYTGWGITLHSSVLSLAGLIFILSGVAWWRMRKTALEPHFIIDLEQLRNRWHRASGRTKLLNGALVMSITLALISLLYAILLPKSNEKYTEFYLIGPESWGISYPIDVPAGDGLSVKAGITNRTGSDAEYSVEAVVDGDLVGEVWRIELADGENAESEVQLSLPQMEDSERVDLLLYEGDELQESLYFWANVRGADEEWVQIYLSEYPREIRAGEESFAKLVVGNYSGETMGFRVDSMQTWNNRWRTISVVEIEPGEKMELDVSLGSAPTGQNRRWIFGLFGDTGAAAGFGEMLVGCDLYVDVN